MKWSGWSDWPVEPRDDSMSPMGTGRPAGLHLSDVLRRVAQAVDPKSLEELPGDQPNVRMQEGFLWERALEYVAAGLPLDEALEVAFKRYMVSCRSGVVKQVQLERDGIHLTPDGFDPVLGICESYKSTRRSLKGASTQEEFENNFWKWIMAEKAYCLALGVDTCRFIVLWHSGDYSRGPGSAPRVLQCTCVWTADELVKNWQMVLKHAEGLRCLPTSTGR